MNRFLLLLIGVVILSSCKLPWIGLPEAFKTPDPFSADSDQTRTPALFNTEIAPTPDSPKINQCAYTWTTQSLPDLTQEVQGEFNRAGFSQLEIIVEAYGESCINTLTNTATGFTVMETDFRITLEVESIQDEDSAGDTLYRIIETLLALPLETYPGIRLGYASVRFIAGTDEKSLRFSLERARKIVEQELRGKELLVELNSVE